MSRLTGVCCIYTNLLKITTNQIASIEQLSSHCQTTSQNVVYTSQLVKLVETSLLAKVESVEKSTQETANKLNQLFEQITRNQQDIVLKIDSITDKISNSQSIHSQQVRRPIRLGAN